MLLGTYHFPLASDVVMNKELAKEIKGKFDAESLKLILTANQKVVIRITGHACDTPIVTEMARTKWGTNLNLSMSRALAVYSELFKSGVSEELLNCQAVGDTKPLGVDKNLNRRVEVTLEVRTLH